MKFATVLAAIAIVNAQEEEGAAEEAAPALGAGEDCAENKAGCDAGLCCAEGVYKEDVVDGEVSDNYLDNLITICNGEKESEYENENGEGYWMTCLEVDGAQKLAAAATAAVAIVFSM